MAYRILEDRCVGCGACAWACLFGVPKQAEDSILYTIDKDKCVGCGHCEKLCPNGAIEPCPDHKTVKSVTILAENCIGCSACARICPTGAAHGVGRSPFEIDQEKCIQCGACITKCRKDAIAIEYI